jgi:hypothetical protein
MLDKLQASGKHTLQYYIKSKKLLKILVTVHYLQEILRINAYSGDKSVSQSLCPHVSLLKIQDGSLHLFLIS